MPFKPGIEPLATRELPILTKSQSSNSNSVTSRVSGDAFQRSASSQQRLNYQLVDLSFQNLADHIGKVPRQGLYLDTNNFDLNNTLHSADKQAHPSLRPSTIESPSIVSDDTVYSHKSFDSNFSLNSDDQFVLDNDPVLKMRNRVRTGSVVAGDSVASTDWGFNSSVSTSSQKSGGQGVPPQSAKSKAESAAISTTNNESSEISLDSTSFDSAKGTEKFDPSDIGEGFHPNSQQSSGTDRLKDLKKKQEDITDYDRIRERAARKAEKEADIAITIENYPKTLGAYRKKPNVSFEPGKAVPDAQLDSHSLTARYLTSHKPDEAGLQQHGGGADDPESYRTAVAKSYRDHFPGKLDSIHGWTEKIDTLSAAEMARMHQRYINMKLNSIPQ